MTGRGGSWSRRFLILVLVLCGWMVGGCALSRPGFPPGGLAPGAEEATEGLPLTAALAESLAVRIRGDAARVSSVRGSAELLVRAGSGAPPRKLLVSLVARRPDAARLRGRFGILATVFDLRSSADTLELYLPREGVRVSGPVSAWQDFPFPGAEWLVQLLLAPVLPAGASDPALWRRTRLGWEVTLVDPMGSARRLTYETETLRLVRLQIRDMRSVDRPGVDVRYSRHRRSGEVTFPGEIWVGSGGRPEQCELKFSSTTINVALPDDLFRMQVPSDVRDVSPGEVEWRLADHDDGGGS